MQEDEWLKFIEKENKPKTKGEKNLNQPVDFEKLPTLKLEQNKITKIKIDIKKMNNKISSIDDKCECDFLRVIRKTNYCAIENRYQCPYTGNKYSIPIYKKGRMEVINLYVCRKK